MTWPTVAVVTTNLDAGTDSPASARSDLKDLADKANQMLAHVSVFAATLLDDATAANARTTLGAAASGANADITSLAAPALGAATATTAAVNDNTTKVATTQYVSGQAASAAPLAHGTAAVGTSLKHAREDHVHLSDGVGGAGQSLTDVAASRAIGTVYTNSTGRPIQVLVRVTGGSASPHRATINSVIVQEHTEVSSSYTYSFAFVVPIGATYSITQGGTGVTISSWLEVR